MALFTVTLLAFQKKIIFLKMSIIWLQLTEISLKFESSSQKLFDLNRLKIVVSKAVYIYIWKLHDKTNLMVYHNYITQSTSD